MLQDRQQGDLDSKRSELILGLHGKVVDEPHHNSVTEPVAQDIMKVLAAGDGSVQSFEVCFHVLSG